MEIGGFFPYEESMESETNYVVKSRKSIITGNEKKTDFINQGFIK